MTSSLLLLLLLLLLAPVVTLCHAQALTFTYLSHTELVQRLESVAERCDGGRATVGSIGKSVLGRDLVMVRLVDNAAAAAAAASKPRVKLLGNMHGDEVVGRQLLLNLVELLCDKAAVAADPDLAQIAHNVDLYIVPSLNPDGYERDTRANANGIDLNRDFPDPGTSPSDSPSGRQPETAAAMAWIKSTTWALSANLHGGAIVANYPWDSTVGRASQHPPDLATFQYIAHTYADNHNIMWQGNACGDRFKDGITEGWQWYDVGGGMQDYNYIYAGVMEITVEVSCSKTPAEETLESYWSDNRKSLIQYVLIPLHIGIQGRVLDADNKPVQGASVVASGIDWTIKTDSEGYFWRLLDRDSTILTVTYPDGRQLTKPVARSTGTYASLTISLSAEPIVTPTEQIATAPPATEPSPTTEPSSTTEPEETPSPAVEPSEDTSVFIVVAVICVLVLLAGVGIYFWRRRRFASSATTRNRYEWSAIQNLDPENVAFDDDIGDDDLII